MKKMDRILLAANLTLATQLHVGSGDDSPLCDAMIYRRPDSALIIPGSSVAGALRGRATRLFSSLRGEKKCLSLSGITDRECDCPTCAMFGNIYPDAGSSNNRLSAKILVHDMEIQLADGTSIRDGVGINRVSRTSNSAAAAKYDYETVARGAQLVLRMEATGLTDKEEVLLAALLAEIGEGRIRFGGKSSRGLGRVSLDNVAAWRLPQCTPAQWTQFYALLTSDDWFLQGGQEIANWFSRRLEEARRLFAGSDDTFLIISGTLRFKEGFLTKESFLTVESPYDSFPLLVTERGKRRTCLPGSSLRGVLRFQTERIGRTLAELNNLAGWLVACDPLAAGESEPGRSCSRRPDKKNGNECLACKLFGSMHAGSRLKISDAWEIEAGKFYLQDYLAVDRFTGGGSEGKKFDSVYTYRPSYYIEILFEEPEAWELGWLLLTLRDLNEGLVSVGSGRAKGLGKAAISEGKVMVKSSLFSEGTERYSGALTVREYNFKKFMQSPEAQRQVEKFHTRLLELAGEGVK